MKVNLLARGEERGSINGPRLLQCLQRWRLGEGGVNSLTISELECRTFYGLSALRLMCEEITLFPTPLNMTT